MKYTIILLLIIILLVQGCSLFNSPDAFANQFMQDLKDGKHLAVQDKLSKEMKQMALLLGGVTNDSLNEYYRTGKMQNYELTRIEATKYSVRYNVLVTCTDGKQYKDILDITKEDGSWKVSRF